MRKQSAYFASAIAEAGARYDRYVANKPGWVSYKARRNRLRETAQLANKLGAYLCELDVLSRDDLAARVDIKSIETLIGSLRILQTVTAEMSTEIQDSGKPRDLAEERWILQLAKIYENAFAERAAVSGSGAEPRRHGRFYRMLELSRPSSFPEYGKLTLRQVARTLKRAGKRSGGLVGEVIARITLTV
jgi:hypothetical protein